MPIEPSLLDLHHFTVRRRGYDPSEVDSVMRRVADSLRRYEERIAHLEERLSEADDSAHAVSRTMVAAQRTHDQLIEEASALARRILLEADREATLTAHEAAGHAADHLAAARDEALTLEARAHEALTAAEREADALRLEANTVLEVATHNTATMRREADEALTHAIARADRILAEAAESSRTMVEDARRTLEVALAEAAASDVLTKERAEDLLSTTRSEVSDLLAESRREAESLVTSAVREARDLRMRVKAEAEDLQARSRARADEIVRIAEAEAAEIGTRARSEEASIVERAEVEAADILARGKSDAAARLSTAQTQAEQLLEHARGQAVEIVADARREKLSLLQRIAELRRAVDDVERQLQRMAARTLDHSAMVRQVIVDQEELERQLALELRETSPGGESGNITIDLSNDVTIDDLRASAVDPFAAPDGSGRPPAARGTVDPRHPPAFDTPRMSRVSGHDARAGRSISEAIAASRRPA